MEATVTTPLTRSIVSVESAQPGGTLVVEDTSATAFDELQAARFSSLKPSIVVDSSDPDDENPAEKYQKIYIEDIKVPFGWPLWALNLLLTLSVTSMHVVESITLPLWIGSYPHEQRPGQPIYQGEDNDDLLLDKRMSPYMLTTPTVAPATVMQNVSAVNKDLDRHFSTDPYFVLTFSMFISALVYGCSLITYNMCYTNKETHKLSVRLSKNKVVHREAVLNALLTAIPTALVFYAASPRRTPPLLQAVLPLAQIPSTMFLRYLILRKYPSWAQIGAALLIVAGLVMSLVPNVLTSGSAEEEAVRLKGPAHYLWPIAFMVGHALNAVPNIFTEDSVKRFVGVRAMRINILAFIFWISLYQFSILVSLFWTDFVPQFGTARNMGDFVRRYWLSLGCFVGANHCSARPGISGTIFLLAFLSENYMTCYLLRYCEGATYVAIAQAFRTPLTALFWTLFAEHPFGWHPHATSATWFSFGALAVMIPALYFYEWAGKKRGPHYAGRCAKCIR